MAKTTDHDLPPEFEGVLDPGEKILWVDKPLRASYVLSYVIPLLFFLPILLMTVRKNYDSDAASFRIHGIPLFIVVIWSIWLTALLVAFVSSFFGHANAFYAISTRRYMIRGGLFGTDFSAIEFDGVKEVSVNVGPVDNLLKVGKIRLLTANVTAKGSPIYNTMVGVRDPYSVYKLGKTTSLDIRSDLSFPNARRPKNNPGYKTAYKGPAKKKKRARA